MISILELKRISAEMRKSSFCRLSGCYRGGAIELAKYKIRVNALLPGAVDTRMLRERLKRNIKNGKNLDSTLKEFEKKHPLGRIVNQKRLQKQYIF